MAHLYFRDSLDGIDVGAEVDLVGAEAKHAAAASRSRVGEEIAVGDGRGTLVTATVTDASTQRVAATVTGIERRPGPEREIVLAQALAKGDRDELAIQAATELGVDRVIPWAAERSVARWAPEKRARGRERWASVVREASKQSLRAWVPEVDELHSTAQLAARASSASMIVLEPDSDTRLTEFDPGDGDVLLVVGPEGGIAPGELAAFAAAGASSARLGPNVLRTSTAGPAAITILAATLGRW
jgi:16S rRNA (uracil1498-N3)-methyltransferase